MLGKFINLFVDDANTTFISISILFSGLAVVAIYYLGKEMFDKKIGLFAAVIALTSPTMWFYGEVALTYIVEGFFSTIIALLCWRIFKGEQKYIWLSAVALGIAGGMRVYSIIFLFPLWIFSIRGLPVRKFLASLGLLGIVCLLWFLPMIWMTGGWSAYREAYRELLLFTAVRAIEHKNVFLRIFSTPLFRFIIYGLGAGIFILGLTVYSLIRHKKLSSLDRSKVLFCLVWLMPSVLFYLWLGLHPAIPGYTLLLLPAIFILTSVSIGYFSNNLTRLIQRDLFNPIALTIIIINTWLFFFSHFPVSYREIRNHDQNISIILEGIKTFNPVNTAIFIEPYMFFSYRHIMYYYPEYRVYNVDISVAPTGERRKLFWGVNRVTFLSDAITLPEGITSFVAPYISDEIDKLSMKKSLNIKNINGTNFYFISGDIRIIKTVFPQLNIQFHQQ
jgi:hypothetical protein